ncbi:MAG: acetolactate synthase large subunit, partial [Candidatus Omnitrophica bacterium]|nr:acetolactate synthase large subunit [Candidatus Omnitrophota bacterium]
IDIDPAEIGKNVRVDVPIVGDVKMVLQELNKLITPTKHIEWIRQLDDLRKKHPSVEIRETDGLLPQYVVRKIYEATNGEAIIATGVGQNQMWAAQYFKFTQPRTFISSGGLGTMGYGFPAAMGAKMGYPDKIVFDIAGDGSFQMNSQELATVVVNDIPVIVAILNNGYLGMVRQWQELFYKKRYSYTCLAKGGCVPDLVRVAESYGAKGIRVTKKEEVDSAIKKAIETDGPVLIDFAVEKEENVFPMVPVGKAINRMIGGMA